MSLARAVTKRIKRSVDASSSSPSPTTQAPTPTRSQSVKTPGTPIDRAKISSPVALLSTTNMLSYNAPDISTLRHASSSSTSSTHSAEDSDHSAASGRSRSSSHASRDTLTDASSVDMSPTSPKPNHLSGYFASSKAPRRSASSGNLQQLREAEESVAVPAIPERALSHSKRAHERLAQKRSLQSIPRSSQHSSRSSREQRGSLEMFGSPIVEESHPHPFGKELEQLNEVAEEFGGVVRDAEHEADVSVLRERNLAVYCAADYLAEIRPLFNNRFGTAYAPVVPLAWI
ncbi:hypothetical protein BU24DRAFT_232121 [Aaosphaeria arxii CBS 175.79]|uniref:Uncharacterized protein n=1 Tax=Aaosphaeria arxii CBS 175.79 TaxID=1450172 RepID=A0A6A5XK42_9PLEO|nr:uncharacterized protein BU24DRAFT_232121 [Aaosphaeria arxii CBS 175.79]KAF2013211.1 hypothetical protein BU24DRAFT_232121 [Aaosphaeria arxii CBS 175.79]